jgi:hypothetical protein
MDIYRLSFQTSDFLKISEHEQAFIVRLANARNDIRHLSILIHMAVKGLDDSTTHDRGIASHQLQHLIRLFASTLHETWEIIRKNWDGLLIGKNRYPTLSSEGQKSIDLLRSYFADGNNPITRIRNKVGFHYDTEVVIPTLKQLSEKTELQILAGPNQHNLFFVFAELLSTPSIFDIDTSDAENEAQCKIRQLREELMRIMSAFISFTDEYLVPIFNDMNPIQDSVNVSDGIDPRNYPSVVIIKE